MKENMSIESAAKFTYKAAGRLLELLLKIGDKLEPLEKLPLLGDTLAEFGDAVSMLHDYYTGAYRKLPFKVMLGLGAIAAYVISPLDIIPDSLPIIGAIDDAMVFKAVMGICIDAELETYRKWKYGSLQTAEN